MWQVYFSITVVFGGAYCHSVNRSTDISTCTVVIKRFGEPVKGLEVEWNSTIHLLCDASCVGSGPQPGLTWFYKNKTSNKPMKITKLFRPLQFETYATYSHRKNELRIKDFGPSEETEFICAGSIKGKLQKAVVQLIGTDCLLKYNFRCQSDKSCIDRGKLCNGNNECPDGEDEVDCGKPCEYRCGDGTCIASTKQCDGYRDCLDGSGEICGCQSYSAKMEGDEPLVPQCQPFGEISQALSALLTGKDNLMCMWDDMQFIPGIENCDKVNFSKLLQFYEFLAEMVPDDMKKKQKELQELVGNFPKIRIEYFKNWSKTQRAFVLATNPESLDQLTRLIHAAQTMRLKVRCAGAKHSWAPLFADYGQLLIYMDNMKSDYPNGSKLYMEPNKGNTVYVDIMAGATNEDFKTFQLQNKVSIPANVILTVVQVASVIVTGCHGVGRDCKCPCDYVVQMRIVDSNGKLKTYTTEQNGKEMMQAAVANFGLFGVVYDMKIKLENKQTFVKTINKYFRVDRIFYTKGELEYLVENNWSVELFWFPMNSWIRLCPYNVKEDNVWVRLINKDNSGETSLPGDEYYEIQKILDKFFSDVYYLFQHLFKCRFAFPWVQAIAFSTLKHFMYPTRDNLYEELPEAVHFRKYIEYVPVYDMEFAFDLSEHENYDLIRQASQFVIEEVEREHDKNRYPLNVAMEMRWMSHSDAYLCPASIVKDKAAKDPKVVYIEILSLEGSEGWEEFCTVVGGKWMELGGVPHLAKQWQFLPNIHNHIREKFGDRINSFKQQLKDSGADPDEMFMNEGLKALLYP